MWYLFESPANSYSYHLDSNEIFGDAINRGNNGKYSIWYLCAYEDGTNSAQSFLSGSCQLRIKFKFYQKEEEWFLCISNWTLFFFKI